MFHVFYVKQELKEYPIRDLGPYWPSQFFSLDAAGRIWVFEFEIFRFWTIVIDFGFWTLVADFGFWILVADFRFQIIVADFENFGFWILDPSGRFWSLMVYLGFGD